MTLSLFSLWVMELRPPLPQSPRRAFRISIALQLILNCSMACLLIRASVVFKDAVTRSCRADPTVLDTVVTVSAKTKAARNAPRALQDSVLLTAGADVALTRAVRRVPVISSFVPHTVGENDASTKGVTSQLLVDLICVQRMEEESAAALMDVTKVHSRRPGFASNTAEARNVTMRDATKLHADEHFIVLRTEVEFDASSKAVTVLQLVNSNFADLMAVAQPVQKLCLHRRHNRRPMVLRLDCK